MANKNAENAPIFLSEPQTAQMLGLVTSTLATWRKRGIGPKSYRFGGTIRYKKDDVLEFIERSEVKPEDAESED